MIKNEDQNAGPVLSAIVLVAAVLFTTNVYMTYSSERDSIIYGEVENSYHQSAAAFLSLRAIDNLASSTVIRIEVNSDPVLSP